MSKRYECCGGCGAVMSGADMWCYSCWPKDDSSIRAKTLEKRPKPKETGKDTDEHLQ